MYRSIGMTMPAIGQVVTRRGALHILRNLPIAASVDYTLSDERVPSGRQRGKYWLKPFAVVPAGSSLLKGDLSEIMPERKLACTPFINPFGGCDEPIGQPCTEPGMEPGEGHRGES